MGGGWGGGGGGSGGGGGGGGGQGSMGARVAGSVGEATLTLWPPGVRVAEFHPDSTFGPETLGLNCLWPSFLIREMGLILSSMKAW